MADTKKVLPYVIFGVPIVIGLYFVYKAIRNSMKKGQDAPDNYNPQQNSQVEPNSKGGVTPSVKKLFPLRKGSKGGKVTELQNAILQYDSTLLGKYGADGDFGSITEKALQTILGKTSADSQDDIDAIIKKANEKKQNEATKVQVENTNKNRDTLARKLLVTLIDNRSLDFRALYDTTVYEADLRIDGSEYNGKAIKYKKGDKIETKGFVSDLTNEGFIKLKVGKKFYRFSPYGFELY